MTNNTKTAKAPKTLKIRVWENLQLLTLALTIFGQVVVRFDWALYAQMIWLAANVLALSRDFVLHRPMADIVKNACLTALTAGLVISFFI